MVLLENLTCEGLFSHKPYRLL